MPRESPYSILGVSPGASKDDIKSAFRRKAKQWHPDRNPTEYAAEQFRKILWASDELLQKQNNKWDTAAQAARTWSPSAEHVRPEYGSAHRFRAGIPVTLAVCGAAIMGSMGLFVFAWRRHEAMYPRQGVHRGRSIAGTSPVPMDEQDS